MECLGRSGRVEYKSKGGRKDHSDDNLYKMWYTKVNIDFTKLNTLLGGIRAAGSSKLWNDLLTHNFSQVASADSAEVKAIISHLAMLTTTELDEP